MGENGVYRMQFYTKLVSLCHFMFVYLYMRSFEERCKDTLLSICMCFNPTVKKRMSVPA